MSSQSALQSDVQLEQFINAASTRNAVAVGHTLQPRTKKVSLARCDRTINGRPVYLVDTPSLEIDYDLERGVAVIEKQMRKL